MGPISRFLGLYVATALIATGVRIGAVSAQEPQSAAAQSLLAARLIAAYPDVLDRLDGPDLVFKDGTRMVFDDGKGRKTSEQLLAEPDLKDQFAYAYPLETTSPPARDVDPGRIRNETFFRKIYGDCTKGQVTPHLTRVAWLPKKKGGTIMVTGVNGVAEHLAAVSRELDELPAEFDRFLAPASGGYNCRPIAGSRLRSAHGLGIAVDINARQSDYWQWNVNAKGGAVDYRNRVPLEIVRIFERHGFIWGGKWYHYDTMHFEYRPELLPPPSARGAP